MIRSQWGQCSATTPRSLISVTAPQIVRIVRLSRWLQPVEVKGVGPIIPWRDPDRNWLRARKLEPAT
jgi:hypothetical protein